jgi:hypothetical protein
MTTFDHRRQMTPCKWRGCNVHLALMGDYCITHWYKSQGKPLPEHTPPTRTAQRPSIDRNTTITGKRETSRAAAQMALPSSGTKRRTVYDLIMANMANGLTADEVQIATDFSPNTINPTIKGLADDGWIHDSGERRPTRTGALAIVWVAI